MGRVPDGGLKRTINGADRGIARPCSLEAAGLGGHILIISDSYIRIGRAKRECPPLTGKYCQLKL